jgi:uncharacterized protein YabE (DUF348 family)
VAVRPSRVERLRARKAVAYLAVAGTVAVVAVGYLAIQKTVTLIVEGRPAAVRTMSSSVGELLESQGIVLDGSALVVPPVPTPLADGMTVVVEQRYYAPLMAAGIGPSQDVGAWVMDVADGSAGMLAHLSPADRSRIGTPGVVAADVVVMGKDHDVLTNAATVGGLLSAMGIEPDRDDRVVPSPSAPLHHGDLVRFVSIDRRVRTVEVPIPHTSFTTYTDDLNPGQTRVVRAGVDGLLRERYRVKVVNGDVVSRELLDRRVLRAAVAEKRLVGRAPRAASANRVHGSQAGEASWYSFAPGSGLTAAHPWLPFGTVVSVTNLANGNSVRVVINDRGPFGGRIIDLSDEAFRQLAPLSQGVARVRLTW